MTAAASALGVAQSLAVQFAAFEAVLLLASGLHKMIRRERLQAVVREFAGVPATIAPFAVAVVALLELLASLLLWVPSTRAAGGMLAALIWGGYLGLILRAIAQDKRDVDCGCTFGAAAQRPLGVFQVARNATLTGVALLVTAGSAAGAREAVVVSQILAALVLLALYGALDQVMALTPPRRGELL
jgi:Methylamine utilisation protein MauE